MGDLFFYRGSGMSECQSNENKTEVSRSHSSEETFVMKVERRAESLMKGWSEEIVKGIVSENALGISTCKSSNRNYKNYEGVDTLYAFQSIQQTKPLRSKPFKSLKKPPYTQVHTVV